MAEAPFAAIDHVQLAMPAGEEERARGFYGDLLSMAEICNFILEWKKTFVLRRRRIRHCVAVIMRD
jgi:4-hydroxyphenylpyruvate dioxygenase-like putative hemolysin